MLKRTILCLSLFAAALIGCGGSGRSETAGFPAQAEQIMAKRIYQGASFAYRVEDLDTGEVIYERNATELIRVASVRKMFSVGLAMDHLGADYRFRTPVYRQGAVTNGRLDGNLVMVATGDLTMGGRSAPDGTIAVTYIDHNTANQVGNGVALAQDPLAGYKALAQQVAASGITQVAGDVIVDDRLYEPFPFREELLANPVFVNDNVIDVQMSPTQAGQPARVVATPASEGFRVVSTVQTVAGGGRPDVDLQGGDCFGTAGCQGFVSGTLPIDGSPVFTGTYPQLQTFRVNDPSSFARTVLIEALRDAGVTVATPTVTRNRPDLLPARGSYSDGARVAQLVSLPFPQYARYILATSYNLGAETALMLYGVTQGVRTRDQAQVAEAAELQSVYGINPSQYAFPDGSGGGDTLASPVAVNRLLRQLAKRSVGSTFRESLLKVGSPGPLTEIAGISNDPSLAGAIGNISAKSGTSIGLAPNGSDGFELRTRASSGYIDAKSGRRLVFTIGVRNVGPVAEIPALIEVFEDIEVISAILWKTL